MDRLQREHCVIHWNRTQVVLSVLIVFNFLLSLNLNVYGRPSKRDDDDHGASIFDDNKSSKLSPHISVPFVIPTSYNKLRVPKFRNRSPPKPLVPFSTNRRLDDENKNKPRPFSTPVPPAPAFAPAAPEGSFNNNSSETGSGASGDDVPYLTKTEENEEQDDFFEAERSDADSELPRPNLVDVRIIIQNIREIDEIDEELTVDMDIILSWVDWAIFQANKDNYVSGGTETERKLVPTESLDPNTLQTIWKPDIFIENAVSIKKPKLISEPVKLLYSPSDGRFVYITRATVKTSCQMEFQYYPSDTQNCGVKLRSYANSVKDVTLNWDKTLGGVYIIDRDDNNFDVRISSVEEAKAIGADDIAHLNFTQHQYHVLEYTISARRKLSYHLIQTYLPSLFFVLITWLCFLIPSDLFEARIGVTMTTLLTLTSMFSSVRENTPIVSYVRAIDIWMVACIYFVFLTLLEFTLLVCLRHRRNKQNQLNAQRKRRSGNSDIESNGSRKNTRDISSQISDSFAQKNSQPMQTIPIIVNGRRRSPVLMRIQSFLGRRRRLRQARDKVSDLIEKYSFISYSVLFVLFNFIYWPWLFVASEHFVWTVDSKYNGPLDE